MMVLRNIFYVPGAYLKLRRYAKHPEKYSREESYAHIHDIMKHAVAKSNVDLQVTGLENLPSEGGFMLYGNHQGMFDIVAIAATCPIPIAAVLKKELRDVPLIHEIMLCTGSYPMDREDVRQSLRVIQAVTKDVKEDGRRFLIFPEGTRSKKGNVMGEFHAGSFRCALKAKCPIVPICYIDCFRPLDEKGSHPLTVQMHYLPPIPYEEFKDLDTVELAAMVKKRIQDCLDEYL
jgi:1-acyl-sn-glycerol-3-phosphate acyltransferase